MGLRPDREYRIWPILSVSATIQSGGRFGNGSWSAVGTQQNASISLAVDHRVGALGPGIEGRFKLLACAFKCGSIGVHRNANRVADNNGAAAEGQIDFRAIPILEDDAPAGRERNRVNGTPGLARELDDAETGHARNLGNIGR